MTRRRREEGRPIRCSRCGFTPTDPPGVVGERCAQCGEGSYTDTSQREFDFQAQLDERPYDRPSTPFATSEAAAESMRFSAGSLRAQVLVMIANRGGMTADEFMALTGRAHQTASPRFWELERRGWIKKSDLQRPTRSGRMAFVYAVTERGAKVAAWLRHQL